MNGRCKQTELSFCKDYSQSYYGCPGTSDHCQFDQAQVGNKEVKKWDGTISPVEQFIEYIFEKIVTILGLEDFKWEQIKTGGDGGSTRIDPLPGSFTSKDTLIGYYKNLSQANKLEKFVFNYLLLEDKLKLQHGEKILRAKVLR